MGTYSKGALICKNDFLGGAYSRGAYLEVEAYSRFTVRFVWQSADLQVKQGLLVVFNNVVRICL